MRVIRVVDRPLPHVTTVASEPCDACGSVMLPAKRFEATRTIAVLICWDCGEERPPLYSEAERVPPLTRPRSCVWCGKTFHPDRFLNEQKTCSLTCADARERLAFRQRSTGQGMRRSS